MSKSSSALAVRVAVPRKVLADGSDGNPNVDPHVVVQDDVGRIADHLARLVGLEGPENLENPGGFDGLDLVPGHVHVDQIGVLVCMLGGARWSDGCEGSAPLLEGHGVEAPGVAFVAPNQASLSV